MALAELLNDGTFALYRGGRFLFRNKGAHAVVEGPISSVVSENSGVRVYLASVVAKVKGHSQPVGENQLQWPIFEAGGMKVEPLKNGVKVTWNKDLTMELFRPIH